MTSHNIIIMQMLWQKFLQHTSNSNTQYRTRFSYPHKNNDRFVVLKQTVEGFTNTVSIKYQTVMNLRDAELVRSAFDLRNGASDLSRYRENGSHCVHFPKTELFQDVYAHSCWITDTSSQSDHIQGFMTLFLLLYFHSNYFS